MKRSKGIDLSLVTWRKSSYSDGQGADCVEVADAFPGVIPVRDSKRPDVGPVLLFQSLSWSAFVGSLKG
ncbi:toxin [Streptomyces yokosukanensis]|uniref:Toxin n=1 Tax=Streptomyces yokosukanensis TaxID=67386 RepID=A0A101P8Z9_9ACTN|nr:DUF397 domain-containing protein [Streptomyces yokosukanensis]KUN07133.1 toxin [Streptomyces yokosukanensis]